ncbi:hypothetical protein [Thermoanaerobacterium aotearoense]|uniref:hypothetical protein n=1 Tax=Thermoanaerobacterium aotearoense TaxID=47490 RepID=UPI001376B67A|nr:hypothetical protein [Thermoanaerobacterium aotearoense]
MHNKNAIKRLYEIIDIFCLSDCLKDEFEAAAEEEDINTIDDLVEYFEQELRYWSDN